MLLRHPEKRVISGSVELMNRRLGRNARLGFGVALALTSAILITACSSSGSSQSPSQSSADEQLCAARTNVQTSFQKVTDDLKALNFGQAKDDVAAAKTALDELSNARDNLNDATKAKIEPDIAALRSAVESVQSATSASEAAAAVAAAKAAFNSALQSIGDAVNCP